MAEKTKSTDFLSRKSGPIAPGPNPARTAPAFQRVGEAKPEPVKVAAPQPFRMPTATPPATKVVPVPPPPFPAKTVSPENLISQSLTERLRQTASVGQPSKPTKKATKKVATKKTAKTATKKAAPLKKATVKVELKTTSPSTADRQVRKALKTSNEPANTIIKSAKTGKIVTAAQAALSPDTTYKTKVPTGKTNATVKVTKVTKTAAKKVAKKTVTAKKAPAKKAAKK